MPKDPVCGKEVAREDAETYEFNGTTYYFCSYECRQEFVSYIYTLMGAGSGGLLG